MIHHIICHGGDCPARRRNLDWVRGRYPAAVVAEYGTRLIPDAIHVPSDGPFSRGRCLNAAVRAICPRPDDVLLLQDSDMFLCDTAQALIDHEMQSGMLGTVVDVILPYHRCRDMSAQQTAAVLLGGAVPKLNSIPVRTWGNRKLVNYGGILAITARAYADIRGYDERFGGWGGEDLAMWHVISQLLRAKRYSVGLDAIHLWHPLCKKASSQNVKVYQEIINLSGEKLKKYLETKPPIMEGQQNDTARHTRPGSTPFSSRIPDDFYCRSDLENLCHPGSNPY